MFLITILDVIFKDMVGKIDINSNMNPLVDLIGVVMGEFSIFTIVPEKSVFRMEIVLKVLLEECLFRLVIGIDNSNKGIFASSERLSLLSEPDG